jgi:hypothetical protein
MVGNLEMNKKAACTCVGALGGGGCSLVFSTLTRVFFRPPWRESLDTSVLLTSGLVGGLLLVVALIIYKKYVSNNSPQSKT